MFWKDHLNLAQQAPFEARAGSSSVLCVLPYFSLCFPAQWGLSPAAGCSPRIPTQLIPWVCASVAPRPLFAAGQRDTVTCSHTGFHLAYTSNTPLIAFLRLWTCLPPSKHNFSLLPFQLAPISSLSSHLYAKQTLQTTLPITDLL